MKTISRYIITLALLITAATGAWATDETLLTTITPTGDGTYSETTAGAVRVTPAGSFFYSGSSYGWRWDDYGSLTVTANEGYTITRCVFIQQGKNQSVTISEAPFALNFEQWLCYENSNMDGVTSIEVYGTAPAASGTPVPLNWDATAKTATLTNGMPAGNVTVSVDYFAQAEFAMSTDATPVALAPTAINDVPATTDGAIVKAGTVADIPGTSPAVKQGTLMYHASQTALTDAELLALTADKWSADVPTAAKLAEGDAYVYYYIQGAEPTEGERSDANTCSDGDISAANVVNVTLAAAPTYNVTFAKDTPEPDKWSAEPNTGLTKGETITVTYTGSKKIIGVKAEKKKVLVTSITLNQTGNITRSNGDSGTLSVTSVLPEDATDKTYTWSSSDPYAVSIDQNGNWRVVGRSGNANLRATANDGSGVYAQITVWVR